MYKILGLDPANSTGYAIGIVSDIVRGDAGSPSVSSTTGTQVDIIKRDYFDVVGKTPGERFLYFETYIKKLLKDENIKKCCYED